MKPSALTKENHQEKLEAASRKAGIAGLFFLLITCVASFFLPPWVTWENGPVEMLQNIILAGCVFLCLYYYIQDKNIYRNPNVSDPVSCPGQDLSPGNPLPYRFWLVGMLFFLLLFGREISWGRVFFVDHMTDSGPSLIHRECYCLFSFIRPVVTGTVILLVAGLVKWCPVNCIRFQIPFPLHIFFLICACALIALLGDKGVLNSITETVPSVLMEEFAELTAYFLLLFLVWYYHKWFLLLNRYRM